MLVGPLVVQAGLADGSNDDPIAGKVDGIAVALIDCRHAAAGEGAVQRVKRPLALQGHDEPLVAFAKVAQHGIGELAVHLDVLLAGNSVPVGTVGRAGVAQHAAKHVGQKVAEDFLFLEPVGLPRRKHLGPLAENRPVFLHRLGQLKGLQVRAECIGPKQGLGFDRQGGLLKENNGRGRCPTRPLAEKLCSSGGRLDCQRPARIPMVHAMHCNGDLTDLRLSANMGLKRRGWHRRRRNRVPTHNRQILKSNCQKSFSLACWPWNLTPRGSS